MFPVENIPFVMRRNEFKMGIISNAIYKLTKIRHRKSLLLVIIFKVVFMIRYIERCQLVANLFIYSLFISLYVITYSKKKNNVKTDKLMNTSLFVIDIRKSACNYCAVNKKKL